MIPLLIASTITCADIDPLIERARNHKGITEQDRKEIVELYTIDLPDSLGIKCDWDANG